MNEDDSDEQRQRGRAYASAALVLFSILYLLALGPISAIYEDCPPFIQSALELAYEPLQVAVELTGTEDSFGSLMEPYAEWCLSLRETEETASSSVYY